MAFRVELCESPRECRGGLGVELAAQAGIAGREVRQPVRERLQVESCSANDDGNASAFANARDPLFGELPVLRGVEGLFPWDFTDEVVRNAGQQGRFWFGREDVEALVDLKSIGADDLAMTTLGHLHRQFRFSHGSGPGDDEDWRERGHEA